MANCLGHSAAHVSTFLLLVTPNNETPDAAQLTEAIAARLINFVDQTGAPEQLWLCLIPKARYNQTHWMYCLSIWAPGLDGPRIESTLMKLVVRSNLHHICSPPAHIIASWGAEAPRTIMKELSHRGHWAVPDPPTHVAATHTGPLFPIQSDPSSHHSAPSLTTSPRWDALPVIQPTGFWEPAMIHLTLCFQARTLAIARNSPADTLDVGHLTAGYTGNLLIPVHSCAPHSHEGKGGMGKAGKGGFGGADSHSSGNDDAPPPPAKRAATSASGGAPTIPLLVPLDQDPPLLTHSECEEIRRGQDVAMSQPSSGGHSWWTAHSDAATRVSSATAASSTQPAAASTGDDVKEKPEKHDDK